MRLVDNRTGLEVLDREECLRRLTASRVGRVAVVVGASPLIFPVNFVLDGDSIVFRTDPGSKLDGSGSGYGMAFEVDGIDEPTREGWSVVVNGVGREVVDPHELTRLQRMSLEPWAAGAKSHWIRLRAGTVTGRRVRQSTR